MSEITLVTAFFEINRSTWVKFSRTEKEASGMIVGK